MKTLWPAKYVTYSKKFQKVFYTNNSARSSYSNFEYLTSFNPQNSHLAKLELKNASKNSYYLSQNSKHSSKIRAWYMFELDSLKLDETPT